MQRQDLIPQEHRLERMFLLDLLRGEAIESVAAAIDPDVFSAVTPATLHPFVHRRLRSCDDRVPASLRGLFAEAYRANALKHLRRVADLRNIDGVLQEAGIPYLVLKGPVLAASVYPEPATRTMTDLDLLVRPADQPRAIAALATLGYVIPDQFAGVAMPAGDAPPLFNGQPGSAVIELHSMLDSAPDDVRVVESVLSQSRMVDVGHGLAIPTLERDEFFAHVVTHVSRHHRFEGELRSLLDVALLLRSTEAELDWAALQPEWNRRRIAGWIALTVWLAHVLLDAPLPAQFGGTRPSSEVLILAAEQLWADKEERVSSRITYLLTGIDAAPVHGIAATEVVAMPNGVEGLRLRARRRWEAVRRAGGAVRKGALLPRNVARAVSLLRNRERMFALVESEAKNDRS